MGAATPGASRLGSRHVIPIRIGTRFGRAIASRPQRLAWYRPRDQAWELDVAECSINNFARNTECLRCGAAAGLWASASGLRGVRLLLRNGLMSVQKGPLSNDQQQLRALRLTMQSLH